MENKKQDGFIYPPDFFKHLNIVFAIFTLIATTITVASYFYGYAEGIKDAKEIQIQTVVNYKEF